LRWSVGFLGIEWIFHIMKPDDYILFRMILNRLCFLKFCCCFAFDRLICLFCQCEGLTKVRVVSGLVWRRYVLHNCHCDLLCASVDIDK